MIMMMIIRIRIIDNRQTSIKSFNLILHKYELFNTFKILTNMPPILSEKELTWIYHNVYDFYKHTLIL
eukprot:UN10394